MQSEKNLESEANSNRFRIKTGARTKNKKLFTNYDLSWQGQKVWVKIAPYTA